MRIRYTATCLFGLEHLLGEEIDALGYDLKASVIACSRISESLIVSS